MRRGVSPGDSNRVLRGVRLVRLIEALAVDAIRSGAEKIDQSSLSNWPLLFRVRMGNAARALRPRPGVRSQSID
jgi:hypothetical protein